MAGYLHSIVLTRILPCLAEPGRIIVVGKPERSLDEVIPYLASLPGVASYNPEACTLTFRRQPGFLTLYADKVYLTQVKDSDSRSLIQAQTVFEARHPDLQLDVQEVSTRKFKMIQY